MTTLKAKTMNFSFSYSTACDLYIIFKKKGAILDLAQRDTTELKHFTVEFFKVMNRDNIVGLKVHPDFMCTGAFNVVLQDGNEGLFRYDWIEQQIFDNY